MSFNNTVHCIVMIVMMHWSEITDGAGDMDIAYTNILPHFPVENLYEIGPVFK